MPIALHMPSYSVPEAAEALGIGQRALRGAIERRELIAYDYGKGDKRHWRVYRNDLQEWVDARCNERVKNGRGITIRTRPPQPVGILVSPEVVEKDGVRTAAFSIMEAAGYMGVSAHTAKRLVQKGEIPHVRIGSTVRVTVSDINYYLEKNTGRDWRNDAWLD